MIKALSEGKQEQDFVNPMSSLAADCLFYRI